MPNTTLDKAIAAVPKFRDRISLFTKELRLAQYADGSIVTVRWSPSLQIQKNFVPLQRAPLRTIFRRVYDV